MGSAAKQAAGITAALLKTGQTTQYGGYEDDGYFKKGIAKSYTINTTGDQSGTTSIVMNGKTDVHSNNTVTDNNTKLEWTRDHSQSVGQNSDGAMPWTTNGNGEGCFEYSALANAANLGGHNDWRVPNFFEILTLCNMEQPTAHPDSVSFPNWSSWAKFLTSTTVPNNTSRAHIAYFAAGGTYTQDKTYIEHVLLVRGGD